MTDFMKHKKIAAECMNLMCSFLESWMSGVNIFMTKTMCFNKLKKVFQFSSQAGAQMCV